MALFQFDKDYRNKGFSCIAGVDEAGRGPLAGPVTAAAVIFSEDTHIPYINDSKKLTPKKREELSGIIKQKALAFHIVSIDRDIIDKINILQATFLAMKTAIEAVALKIKPEICLIDGNQKISGLNIKQETVIGGDAKSASIAAASILAKVARDEIMMEYAKQYPEYLFEKHKGYGTKAHLEAIKKYGPCPIHRLSFAPMK